MVSERLEHVRDLFVFSCFCGLAYSDVANLRQENIQKSFDGNLWIITKRQKTNTDVNVPLLDIPKMILKKYKGKLPDGQDTSRNQQSEAKRLLERDCRYMRY